MPSRRKASLLDTNVLLRYLLNDVPLQAGKAHGLFRRIAEGKEAVEMTDVALLETVWVLEHQTQVPRHVISRSLLAVLRMAGIRHRSKRVIFEALRLFAATSCDFADCLLAAKARVQGNRVITFDADFRRLGCAWTEPS